jgi:CrcB protein
MAVLTGFVWRRNLFKLLVVGLGGFVGAILRYTVSGFVQNVSGSISFPYGTLAVNILGCLLIGMLAQIVDSRNVLSADVRLFIFIGLLGAFTTYSTFGHETLGLLRDGRIGLALINVGLQVVLCLSAVWFGRFGAHLIWR